MVAINFLQRAHRTAYLMFAIMFCVLTTLSLSGCATRKKQDGPPRFHVDETKIPNAVPKKEPLSKYGNMRSYSVFGKRYYTLKTSKRFNQTGVASWYGTMFHARKTSSGEKYDMLAMTAAHKTLPLPTYVEVTNLSNKKKVIVKVNDRGPFSSNRIIDLSYVAAKKLGMLARGTAHVRIKAIDPATYGKSYKQAAFTDTHRNDHSWKPSSDERSIYLQVGAFKKKANAIKLKQRLSKLLRLPVNIFRSKNRYYRVQVGPIHDVATMNKLSNRLKGLGIKPNKTFGV